MVALTNGMVELKASVAATVEASTSDQEGISNREAILRLQAQLAEMGATAARKEADMRHEISQLQV